MDNRTFIQRLAKATDSDTKTAGALASALGAIIGELAADQDSTAIPGFGTFASVKTPDYVATDPETGAKTLVPPSIAITFKPGSRLKKSVSKR